MSSLPSKTEGLLIGTAVADAIGLPMEGMRPAKIEKLGWARSLKHRFLFGRGMWSDDTEQTIMLTQALLSSGGDVRRFTRSFAWELRWWILGMPAATGLATAKAIIKLWLGFPPSKSGVFSAGNGSAMRTTPIAAMFPDDAEKRRIFTEAHTRITHSDPKASLATLAVTEVAAALLKSQEVPDLFPILKDLSVDEEWRNIVDQIQEHLEKTKSLEELLKSLGGKPEKGISGYVYQTVPAVLFLGIKNNWSFEKTIPEVIAAGGDTDTTAAIAGALCGAYNEVRGIPQDWIKGVYEWPTHISDLKLLSQAFTTKKSRRIRARWSPLLLMRNLFFLVTVLAHGLARLLPIR